MQRVKSSSVSSLSLGGELSAETLAEIEAALKPHWSKLTTEQQQEAKVLAAGMLIGNQDAAAEFRARLIIWFPFPIPPFPPIIWDAQGAPVVISSVAIGLIIIGIGIMLL